MTNGKKIVIPNVGFSVQKVKSLLNRSPIIKKVGESGITTICRQG